MQWEKGSKKGFESKILEIRVKREQLIYCLYMPIDPHIDLTFPQEMSSHFIFGSQLVFPDKTQISIQLPI